MKVIALTAALAFGATSAFAGSMETVAMDPAPMVEMEKVEEAPTGTSPFVWLIPLMAIAAIALTSDSD